MALLTAQKLNLSYVIDPVLEDISFMVEKGDAIGIVGLNGSGKTTLFKLIDGTLAPDSGQVITPQGFRIGHLSQMVDRQEIHLSLYDYCLIAFNQVLAMEAELRDLEHAMGTAQDEELEDLLARYGHLQEVFVEHNGYGYKSAIRGTLIGLGFTEDEFHRSVAELSGGQKARLNLARLLLDEPDLLLLDEPTNHLDIKAIAWLEKFLQAYPKTYMVISHDRYFLDKVVKRIFHLEHRRLTVYETNYTGFMRRRKEQMAIRMRQQANQQKEKERQEEIIRRFKNYGNARYIKQAQAREKLLAKMATLPPIEQDKKMLLRFSPEVSSGEDVILTKDLGAGYGDQLLFSDASLHLRKGEHIGIIGDNGTGKTTLFRLIQGKLLPKEGELALGARVQIGYFDQEMARLDPEKTVMDQLWDHYPRMDHYQIRSYLARFMFVGDDIYKTTEELSGGEKGRLSLLILMLSGANLLLMDEPTNHLDIDSKEVLEAALRDYDGTLLVISHDRYFLNRVATGIWAVEDGTIRTYLGNYDYYEAKKEVLAAMAAEDAPEPAEETLTQKRERQKRDRQAQAEARAQKRALKDLETRIHNLEAQIQSLDENLADPTLYEDFTKAQDLAQERADLAETLESLYDKWMELVE